MYGARLFFLTTAAILVGAVVSAGAGPTGKSKWWQSEPIVRELGLTADQSARIEAIFQASLPALKASKSDLDRLEKELSRMLAEGTLSEAAVLHQIDRVEASRAVMGRTRSLMLFRMHLVLTREQRLKLQALHGATGREQKE
jgi:Spy/CpxP family protein refolding chaperone